MTHCKTASGETVPLFQVGRRWCGAVGGVYGQSEIRRVWYVIRIRYCNTHGAWGMGYENFVQSSSVK